MSLTNRHIAVYVTGGIAAYKAADFVRELIKHRAEVRVAMTPAATAFVSPLTFQILTKHAVATDTFDEQDPQSVQHIALADWSDLAIVVPATANTLAKLAHGIADNFVTSALLATTAPKMVMPAMNSHMWRNPATQRNIQQLRSDGYTIVNPDQGFLAEGYEGVGRLPNKETLLEAVYLTTLRHNTKQPLRHHTVLVTAGGTQEKIDPVRYITNQSSGKMGYALARRAAQLGARVVLISATRNLPEPLGVEVEYVTSASEMAERVYHHFATSDITIMAAAVSDFRPANPRDKKWKKDPDSESYTLPLIANPDILATLGSHKKEHQFLVGFAAETDHVAEHAQQKLLRKQVDLMVANDVSQPQIGFNAEDNAVSLFFADNHQEHLPQASKDIIAQQLFEAILAHRTTAKSNPATRH